MRAASSSASPTAATSPPAAGSAASVQLRFLATTAPGPKPRLNALPRPGVFSEGAEAQSGERSRAARRSSASMTPSDEFFVVDSEKFDLAATERLFELFAMPRGE